MVVHNPCQLIDLLEIVPWMYYCDPEKWALPFVFTSRHDDSLQRPAVADTPRTAAPESGSSGAVQVPTWHLHVTARRASPYPVSLRSHQSRIERKNAHRGWQPMWHINPLCFTLTVCWRTGQGEAGIPYIEEQDQIVRKKRTFQYNASKK